MLANTLTITYDAASVELTKISEQNNASTYFGEALSKKFTLEVKHTIPQRGQAGESHLVKLTVEHFDGSMVYLRGVSPWVVIKTFDGVQDSAAAVAATSALLGALDAPMITSIVGRQS